MDANKRQKLLTTGAVIGLAEPLLLGAMHAGGIGAIVGLGAGALAYGFYDDLAALAKGKDHDGPSPSADDGEQPRQVNKTSLAYRLLNGKSTRGELAPAGQEEMGGEPQTEELPKVPDRYSLLLGEQLCPHADTFFSRRVTILGKPGAGKSNAVAVVAEELARYNAPLIIFDHKPEYGPMCAKPFMARPVRAGVNDVSVENARAMAGWIMQNRAQMVLDLQSFKDDTTAAIIMTEMIWGLFAWQEQIKNDGGKPMPCTVILDEAHHWLPQHEQHSTVSKKQDKEGRSVFNKMQHAFFTLVNGGRSFGLGCVISTQRVANIDNRAISVADWRILLNADHPSDLKIYKELAGVEPETASTLKEGQAYVKGMDGTKGVYQLRRRNSPDESKTPGHETLQRPLAPMTPLPTSQAGSIPTSPATSISTSDITSQAHQEEVDRNEARRATKGPEVALPLRSLSERERRIGVMFFREDATVSKIMKEVSPDAKGGDAYTRAAAEVQEAIRKYAMAEKHAAIQAMRAESEA